MYDNVRVVWNIASAYDRMTVCIILDNIYKNTAVN